MAKFRYNYQNLKLGFENTRGAASRGYFKLSSLISAYKKGDTFVIQHRYCGHSITFHPDGTIVATCPKYTDITYNNLLQAVLHGGIYVAGRSGKYKLTAPVSVWFEIVWSPVYTGQLVFHDEKLVREQERVPAKDKLNEHHKKVRKLAKAAALLSELAPLSWKDTHSVAYLKNEEQLVFLKNLLEDPELLGDLEARIKLTRLAGNYSSLTVRPIDVKRLYDRHRSYFTKDIPLEVA